MVSKRVDIKVLELVAGDVDGLVIDRIIVMEDGQVAEQGTHDQLIEAGTLYSELWNGKNLMLP